MSLLIVGTLAFDCIETPNGVVDDVMGGSSSFSSYAASFFTKPRLIAPVGDDFPDSFRQVLAERGIDLSGVVRYPGQKSFRWRGRYHRDMNTRDTLEVHLNVLEKFDPVVPGPLRECTHVFLANLHPVAQGKVLDQMASRPKLVVADTMDFWIETTRDALLALLPRLDGLLINDYEAKMLTREDNLVRAGQAIRQLGPKFVIVKKGEHGAGLFTDSGVTSMPAYPTENVIDPTGAGDTFAGGILGYLTRQGEFKPVTLRRAIAYGTVMASLTCEGFGLDRLRMVTSEEIEERLAIYKAMLSLE